MNQQCKVCGEPAAGFHFGAFTCEGCKSFFGRTYNNLGSISECKNGGNCVINKKNRTACKACRLRKCIVVGMSKSGSRYGRRSNWFKIHCLLQEQTNNGQCLPPNPFATSLLPGFLPPLQSSQNIFTDKDRTSPSEEDLALHSQLLHFSMMKKDCSSKSPHPDDFALQQQLNILAWQKDRERVGQHQKLHQQPLGSPPRDCTPSPFTYKHAPTSPMFPATFASKEMTIPSSPPDAFTQFASSYKRGEDTPSDSGASSVDSNEHDESRSNSALSYFKDNTSPVLSEREYLPGKISSSAPLTTSYNLRHGLSLIYSPAALQHSPNGGALKILSPTHSGVVIQQDEPIDLSIRSTHNSSHPANIIQDRMDYKTRNQCSVTKETSIKSKPLDLTLNVKKPIELGVSM